MTKTNINLKPLKIAFSAHIGSFLDALNTPFYPYYKIYLREIFNYNIFFKVLQFVGISHQNYYRTFGRKRKTIFIRTIFWVVIGPCRSIYDQVNVEILILKCICLNMTFQERMLFVSFKIVMNYVEL